MLQHTTCWILDWVSWGGARKQSVSRRLTMYPYTFVVVKLSSIYPIWDRHIPCFDVWINYVGIPSIFSNKNMVDFPVVTPPLVDDTESTPYKSSIPFHAICTCLTLWYHSFWLTYCYNAERSTKSLLSSQRVGDRRNEGLKHTRNTINGESSRPSTTLYYYVFQHICCRLRWFFWV